MKTVEVKCLSCGRPEQLAPDHAARLAALGIQWTCRVPYGCSLLRTTTAATTTATPAAKPATVEKTKTRKTKGTKNHE